VRDPRAFHDDTGGAIDPAGREGSPGGVMGPGGGHAVIDDLHELRTAARSTLGGDAPETNRDQITADIINWIQTRT